MFGANKQVGRKYFETMAKDQLLVSTMFVTLQGEGPFSGCPAFFLRLAKCNLSCSFCDTDFDNGDVYTFEQLDKAIKDTLKEYFRGVVPHWADRWVGKKRDMVLVMTGGEPSLQTNLSKFLEQQLQTEFCDVQIESNGILLLPDLPEEVFLVISPKCNEEKGKPTQYLAPHHAMLERADCLKFVMSADTSSPYSFVPAWAHNWQERTGGTVFVSPMNVYLQEPTRGETLRERIKAETVSFWQEGLLDREKNKINHEFAANYCARHGTRLSLQSHLYASLP